MIEMERQTKREIKKLVNACVDDADGFRASEKFAELKRKCKQNESNVDLLYRSLRYKFRHHYVETRICALNLADEFFMRSHRFRTILLDEFNELVDCVLDVRIDTLLSSREAVRDLRKLAIRLVRKWQAEFGSGYPQLANALDYLRFSKKLVISDEDGSVITRGDIRERLERDRRDEQVAMRKLAGAQAAYSEIAGTLNDSQAELESLIQIFRSASNSNANLDQDAQSTSTCSNSEPKSSNISVQVIENEENSELIQLFLRHRFKLENEYTPKLQSIVRSISGQLSFASVSAFARELIDRKSRIDQSVNEARVIRIVRSAAHQRLSMSIDTDSLSQTCAASARKTSAALPVGKSARCGGNETAGSTLTDSEEEDDDFIEVRQDGTIESRPTTSKAARLDAECSSQTQPTASTLSDTSAEAREDMLEIDYATLRRLQNNVDEQVSETVVPKRVSVFRRDDSDWVKCDSNEVELPASFCADLQRRVFTFAGHFEPVLRSCNAPLGLSDGDSSKPRLCPRRDRIKCPFHGLIIDRDEFGKPIDSSNSFKMLTDSDKDASSSRNADAPSTSSNERDQFSAAIAEAIRNDLSDHVQSRLAQEAAARGRKRKREERSTAKDRISEIVLDRRTLQRVGEMEDHAIRARNEKKFAQQFNYSIRK